MLAVLALLWIGLLVAAPAMKAGVVVSGATYSLGALICHQLPERSFHLAGAQLPVCARCLGLYVGAAIGACLATYPGLRRTAAGRRPVRSILVSAAGPTAATVALELVGLLSPSNATRAVAALPLGAAIAWAVTLNYDECAQPRRPVSRTPPTPS